MEGFPEASGVWEAELLVRPFGLRLCVCFMEESGDRPTARQITAFKRFQSLPLSLPSTLRPHALKYCNRIDDIVNLSDEGIVIDRAHIEDHYRITELMIPRLADCEEDYFFVSADCDWEPEHGMQIVLENDVVLYCGDHTTLAAGAAWNRVLDAPIEARADILRKEIAKL